MFLFCFSDGEIPDIVEIENTYCSHKRSVHIFTSMVTNIFLVFPCDYQQFEQYDWFVPGESVEMGYKTTLDDGIYCAVTTDTPPYNGSYLWHKFVTYFVILFIFIDLSFAPKMGFLQFWPHPNDVGVKM